MPLISIVVPVYKEENNIRPFLKRLIPVVENIGSYEVLFCLDPSPDQTENILKKEIEKNSNISMFKFSRRFGQPAANMAGILNCRGQYCVVIDVDLQDPPELIQKMYEKMQEGFEVVCAQRKKRKGETFLKKTISYFGYKLINKIANIEIPVNTGDFRMISRRVIEELRKIPESHCFLRGLVSFVGFKQAMVQYERDARFVGKGKYNRFTGSFKIGFNGVFGFSSYFLTFLLFSGIFLAFIAFIGICYIFISKFIFHYNYPHGLPSILVMILFMGGIQLISIGILGEYIGRIYDEVKQRPRYIIDRVIKQSSKKSEAILSQVGERER